MILIVIVLTSGWVAWSRFAAGRDEAVEVEAEVEAAATEPLYEDTRKVSDDQRIELLSRAQVWRTPKVPIAKASFAGDATIASLTCKFKVTELGGTTPKFDCDLEDGQEIRIKYGKGPEIPAEAAATRLLKALGFGADDVTLVEKLRCYGCPEEPFSTMKVVEVTGADPLYRKVVDYDDFEEFDWVALERKFNARPIKTAKMEGWSFYELDIVDSAKGGAPRAHIDALRLMAVFIAHWDNKAENQRLVCLSRNWAENGRCAHPFLLLQDVGATFGPTKVDLDAWVNAKVWEDRASCKVSMRELPYDGATFGEARITEAGRQFAGRLLSQLSDQQLTELFTAARFDQKRGLFSASKPVADWVSAFKARVRTITDGSACPST